MRVTVSSVLVNDQAKAHKFYTEKLGFVTKMDMPMGDGSRWLTLVSPENPDGVELLLEPTGHPASPIYQKAIYDSGIPLTMFSVDDVRAEYARLKALGVEFRGEPATESWGSYATFDDTVGNLIMLHQA